MLLSTTNLDQNLVLRSWFRFRIVRAAASRDLVNLPYTERCGRKYLEAMLSRLEPSRLLSGFGILICST